MKAMEEVVSTQLHAAAISPISPAFKKFDDAQQTAYIVNALRSKPQRFLNAREQEVLKRDGLVVVGVGA